MYYLGVKNNYSPYLVNVNTIMNLHVTNKEVKQIYHQLKSSAKKRGIYFDLTLTDLNQLSFPLRCPILNMPLQYNRGMPQDNSYSIDRRDSSKGYTIDNIVVISNRANKLKSDATLTEMRLLFEFYSSDGGV
jgi:hypothetical protein